ncbi:MAG TPA: hypothetical protein VK742_16880 [Candidatus Sulfotelmatobacter sp.]|jgi:hypothetical protein|nr:hypothetical protein [Candidatus Sulfotelmatobacter sp.]
MQFIKKHYEKILLGVVLAGLVGALVFMPFYISSDNAATREQTDTIINPSTKTLPDLDLSAQAAAAARLRGDYSLDLDTTNKVFNPQVWVRQSDGTIVPAANHTGPQMCVVTGITPLYLVISLDSVSVNELGARYSIGVEKQAEKNPSKRRKQERSSVVGDKPNDMFSIVSVKGDDTNNPTEVDLKLTDTGEMISIASGKPYKRVDGYMADFRYDPEKLVFQNARTGDVRASGHDIVFNGTRFMVDDVQQNQLVLQDLSNQKKTTLNFTP